MLPFNILICTSSNFKLYEISSLDLLKKTLVLIVGSMKNVYN